MGHWIDEKIGQQRYRVNVLHQGKERWKYCRTIKKARQMQEAEIVGGLSSIIYQKKNGKYVAI